MKLGIMQPYFFPYIGYFQLIKAVDKFVVYDNIKFVKGGWINRNRILMYNHPVWLTLSLKGASDFLHIRDRYLFNSDINNRKLLRLIENAYHKAPCFREIYQLIEECLKFNDDNLFNFLLHSIHQICNYLDIATEIVVSSNIPIDHSLKREKKILAFCQHFNADIYINLPGGKELYSKDFFSTYGINLLFLEPKDIIYTQWGETFFPRLSIIDVLMFNKRELVREYLDMYTLI